MRITVLGSITILLILSMLNFKCDFGLKLTMRTAMTSFLDPCWNSFGIKKISYLNEICCSIGIVSRQYLLELLSEILIIYVMVYTGIMHAAEPRYIVHVTFSSIVMNLILLDSSLGE